MVHHGWVQGVRLIARANFAIERHYSNKNMLLCQPDREGVSFLCCAYRIAF